MSALNTLTIAEARDGLRARDFSAAELTEACLAAIDGAAALNAFVHHTPDLARAQAGAADARLARGGEAPALEVACVGPEAPTILMDDLVVRCDDGTFGNTPLVITARTEPVRCELSAEGHVTLVHVVKPGLGRTSAQVALQLPAFLSARAWPGAARLLIDGRPLPDSFVARLAIPPGRHKLEAVIERDGRTWRKTETIEARAGQELSVEVRIADYPAEGAAP